MKNHHDHRRNSSVGDDKFSFPTIPATESQGFEFGSTTTPPTPSSPADRLFSNGKLLPHSFPSQPTIHLSRSTSVTSSNTDSSLSSRSNSSASSRNTSGSGCSSARTSISESWASASASAERKLFSQHAAKIAAAAATRGDEYIWNQYQAKKPVLKPHYSSSRRWQFIAPAPAGLRHQNSASSRSRKVQSFEVRGEEEEDDKEKNKPARGFVSSLFRRRFFRWIVSSCRGCHAMNPPPVKDLTSSCHCTTI